MRRAVTALEPLMRDPASAIAMGERARARVEEKFSLDAEANAIAAVYRTLIAFSSEVDAVRVKKTRQKISQNQVLDIIRT